MNETKKMIIAACVLFLIALLMTLYPIISNVYNEKHQSEIHTVYQEEVAELTDEKLRIAKESAMAYNESIRPGVQTEDAYSSQALISASLDYAGQLDIMENGIMGYVKIPKIGVTLPIYHGTNADTLELGIGHLLGSSLPIGGESNHAVLTAHSGMASQKMFSDIDVLKRGDVFYLEVLDEILAYQVDNLHTVLPHETDHLTIVPDKDYCTLVTCTPFGVNTHRLLVRGERIPYEEATEIEVQQEIEEHTYSTWEEKYANGIILGLILFIIIDVIGFIYIYYENHKNAA